MSLCFLSYGPLCCITILCSLISMQIQLISENSRLEDLTKSLNDPSLCWDTVRPEDVKEGLVCAVSSSMDGQWYRVWLVGHIASGPEVSTRVARVVAGLW